MSKQKRIINKPLTSEEFRELKIVSNDPFAFSNFIYLIHQIRGKVKFELYPFQIAVLWQFIRHRFNIILKFRQAGITELISMFCLWYAMYHPNKNIVIISIKDRVAKKVLRKIKFMYRNLPPHLQVQVVNGRSNDIGSAQEIEFANGSTISSIPTTEDAGRSESVAILVIDEAAIVRWADQIWAASFPTLSTGGRAIVNSTPFGIGNFFHKKWVEACAGGNEFNPIRLRWEMHPERDQEWYRQMSTSLGPRRTAQEIDGDFLTSGNSVFDLRDIRAMEEMLTEYEPLDLSQYSIFNKIRSYGENLIIYKLPEKNGVYSIGSDVSTGRSRDYSSITLTDQYGEDIAVLKKKLPPNELANLLGGLGKIYNRALVAPESNDIGLAVASKLQDDGYPNLYYSVKLIKKRGQKKPETEKIPGWYTTKKNRPVIIGGLEEDIRLDNIIVKDPFFIAEAYTFIYDETNRPVAMGKSSKSGGDDELMSDEDNYTDDAIMGKAIANHIRKIKRKGPIILPQ